MTKRKQAPRRKPQDFSGSRLGNDQSKVLSFKKAGGNLLEMSRIVHEEFCIKAINHEGLISSNKCECNVKLILKNGEEL
jgi:hypothetical protein